MEKNILTLCFVVISSIGLLGQNVPSMMNYQGNLTDVTGAPLPDGIYLMEFKLFEQPVPQSGEQLIWGRQYDVTLLSGTFNVILGPTGAASIDGAAVNDLTFALTTPNRFLEVGLVTDSTGAIVNRTILPRQQLLSAPFAIMAANGVPPGSVMPYFGTSPPPGWVMCDGGAYPREGAYARLFASIGTSCGAPNASSFNVPDLRGRFLRGVDVSSGTRRDPDNTSRTTMAAGGNSGRNVGSIQGDATKRPNRAFTTSNDGGHEHRIERQTTREEIKWGDGGGNSGNLIEAAGAPGWWEGRNRLVARHNGYHTHSISDGGDAETRPVNVYVNYIIKY